MKWQRGAISLLTTAVLLLALLLLVLGSYRAVFYQIKISQNEVEARRIHWLAEGAVECLYAYIQVSGVNPDRLLIGSSDSHFDAMQALCLSDVSMESLYLELPLMASPVSGHYRLVYQRNGITQLSRAIVLQAGSYQWQEGAWNDS